MDWIQMPLKAIQWKAHGAFVASTNVGKFLSSTLAYFAIQTTNMITGQQHHPVYRRLYTYPIWSAFTHANDWLQKGRPSEITDWNTHMKI
jgi:hypothetical protein